MAVKRHKRKSEVVEGLPNPGERLTAPLPDWRSKYRETNLRAMHTCGRQLVAGEPIGWDELSGRR